MLFLETLRFIRSSKKALKYWTRYTTIILIMIMATSCGEVWSDLKDSRLKESVVEQKKIKLYFQAAAGPRLETCWIRIQDKGTIEIKYRFLNDTKGREVFNTLDREKSSMLKGQDKIALACMQDAVTATRFAK